jgi:hypothetical protein
MADTPDWELLADALERVRETNGISDSKWAASAGMDETHGLSAGAGNHVTTNETAYDWEEPDWSILDDRRGELPPFPIETLPEACGDWVERAAHGAGATAAHRFQPYWNRPTGESIQVMD